MHFQPTQKAYATVSSSTVLVCQWLCVLGATGLFLSSLSWLLLPATVVRSSGNSDEIVFWSEDAGGGEQSRCEEHSVPAGDKGETCQGLNSSELTHRSASHSHKLTYLRVHTNCYNFFLLCFAFSL